MLNLRRLSLYRGRNLTQSGFLSLFNDHHHMQRLEYLEVTYCYAFDDECVDALTKW